MRIVKKSLGKKHKELEREKSGIDWKKIEHFCAANKRPDILSVSDAEWRDALLGIREIHSETDAEEPLADGSKFGTETMWTLIWMAAFQFCKGLVYERIASGKIKDDHYPKH